MHPTKGPFALGWNTASRREQCTIDPIVASYDDIVIEFALKIPRLTAEARARLEPKALAPSLRP